MCNYSNWGGFHMSKNANDLIHARLCHLTQDTQAHISGASFLCVLDGAMNVTINSHTSELEKEDVIYIEPDMDFSICIRQPVLLLIGVFHPCFLLENLGFKWRLISCDSTREPHKDYKQLIAHIAPLIFSPAELSGKISNYTFAKAFDFLYLIENNYIEEKHVNEGSTSSEESTEKPLEKIRLFLDENYSDPISLTDTAEAFNYTPPYLSSLIKKKMHMTFQEYLTGRRLEAAFLYVSYTDSPLQKIFIRCGFSNQSSFIQAFERKYQCTPDEWRASHPCKKPDLPETFDIIASDGLSRDYLFNYTNYETYTYSAKEIRNPGKTYRIQADTHDFTTINFHANAMINLGSATNFDKPAFRKHIHDLQTEKHFKYGRFSDLFLIIQSFHLDGRQFYDFSKFFRVFDFLRSIDMMPLIELGNKPFHIYNFDERDIDNYDIYNNAEQYDNLFNDILPEFIDACIARYGFDEVSSWKFELWRRYSPSLVIFEPVEDYVERFGRTAQILKSRIPDVILGGPGFNSFVDSDYFELLLKGFKGQTYTPDFFSAYYFPYSGMNEDNPPRRDKNVYYSLSQSIDEMSKKTSILRALLDQYGYSDRPFYVTEYSAFMSEGNTLNDSVYPALYIIYQTLHNYQYTTACAYWLVSDISLEYHNPNAPFFGGNGLISRDGIFKPACFAYTLLEMLGEQVLSLGEQHVVTRRADGSVQVLLYYIGQLNPDFAHAPSEHNILIHPYSPFTKQLPMNFSVELSGMISGHYTIRQYRMSMEQGSIINSWKNLSYSENLDASDFTYIQNNSGPYLSSKQEWIDTNYMLHTTINPNEVIMYVFKPFYDSYQEFLEKGKK